MAKRLYCRTVKDREGQRRTVNYSEERCMDNAIDSAGQCSGQENIGGDFKRRDTA
jgi:hypothetical protein